MESRYGQIIMFGDSLTQQAWSVGGTGASLADLYQRKFDIVNRGFSGYNTEWALRVAPTIFRSANPADIKMVTIWFGANDAVLPFKAQHVKVATFKENLHTIMNAIPAGIPILLITPPPISLVMRRVDVDTRFPGQNLTLDRTIERTQEFVQAVTEVVDEAAKTSRIQSIGLVELHNTIELAASTTGQGDREKGLPTFLSDGLHLTAAGYEIVTKQILAAIDKHFPHLNEQSVTRRFPLWDQISPTDPDAAFM